MKRASESFEKVAVPVSIETLERLGLGNDLSRFLVFDLQIFYIH